MQRIPNDKGVILAFRDIGWNLYSVDKCDDASIDEGNLLEFIRRGPAKKLLIALDELNPLYLIYPAIKNSSSPLDVTVAHENIRKQKRTPYFKVGKGGIWDICHVRFYTNSARFMDISGIFMDKKYQGLENYIRRHLEPDLRRFPLENFPELKALCQ